MRLTVPKFSLALTLLMSLGILLATFSGGQVFGQQALDAQTLADRLKQGGYVIAMRHAASPREAPTRDKANADNRNAERQLDQEGRETATAMGEAIRNLKIPIGQVYSSPTYRALETVQYAQLGTATPAAELGDNGQSMQVTSDAQSAWIRQQVAIKPAKGNTVLVTHFPNLTRAFPDDTKGVADGEAIIFAPDGKGGATVLGRIKIGQWPSLH